VVSNWEPSATRKVLIAEFIGCYTSSMTFRNPSLSPAHYLANAFSLRRNRNPRYSLRGFARDLSLTHGYLSSVLNGKKKLSLKRALDLATRIGLDEQAKEYFLQSVAQSHLSSPPATRTHPTLFFDLELDRFQSVSAWYHIAILDLTLIQGFRPDPIWISRKIGIPRSKVKDAISRLERLGLLQRHGSTLQKTHVNLAIPTKNADRAIRLFHEGMISKAMNALQGQRPVDYQARDITATTIPADPKRLPEAKRRIAKFRRSLLRFLSQGETTELYQLNVQLFSLTPISKPRRRNA
jgi:uncharacterized protein (TIGR02147 family)